MKKLSNFQRIESHRWRSTIESLHSILLFLFYPFKVCVVIMEETYRRKGCDAYPDEWVRTQDLLKRKLVAADDFTWKLTSYDLDFGPNEQLRYVGGTDISFLKEDPSIACAALVILEIGTLKIVHEEFDLVSLDVPYIPGFLAFRERRVWATMNYGRAHLQPSDGSKP